MHSFQPSRGRVFFEVLCALGMSASLAGAWMQTHATALLGTAGIAALYGLVHLFDMRRPKSTVADEPQRIDFAPESADVVVPMVPIEERAAEELPAEEIQAVQTVEAAAPRSGGGRRSGGSRKGSGRRAKAPKVAEVAEPQAVEEADVPWPMAEKANMPEPEATDEEEFAFSSDEDESRSHIEPLFEPEPFARMPRRAFGRRGRL